MAATVEEIFKEEYERLTDNDLRSGRKVGELRVFKLPNDDNYLDLVVRDGDSDRVLFCRYNVEDSDGSVVLRKFSRNLGGYISEGSDDYIKAVEMLKSKGDWN